MVSAEETSSLHPEERQKGVFGVRHGQIALLFTAMICSYMVRLNLSDGIVAMTDSSANPHYPTLNWTNAEKGTLLAMFFYGYILSTLPGGFIVTKLTPKLVMSGAGIMTGLLNMGFPYIAIKCGYHASCLCRVATGVLQGMFVPGVSLHISRWAAPNEKGRFASLVYSGNSLGSFLMLCSGGYLAKSSIGWPSIFYLSGACICLWGFAWYFLSVDSPSVHPTITLEERIHIEGMAHASNTPRKLPVPWLQIFTSRPLWITIIAVFSFNWGYWTIQTMLPTYMEGVLKYELSEDGLLSSLPSLGMACAAITFPFLDKIISRYFELSIGFHRKFWNSVALYSSTLIFLALAFIKPEAATTVTMLVVASILFAGELAGAGANVLDLTNNFAGVVAGILNSLSNMASLIAPIVAGFIVTDNSDVNEWRKVFLIAAILFFFGNTVFLIFSSFEVQSWNEPEPKKIPRSDQTVTLDGAVTATTHC